MTFKTRVIQSPMAGCTDLAFRLLAREYGMEFAFLEMVSAEALVRENRKTQELLKSDEKDAPLGAQIVGCNPETMGKAASMIEDMGFQLLDLNLGCPVKKITSPGAGSALLREPEKAREIFEAVIKNVKNIPVTVKMRLGFSDTSGNEAIQIAKYAEEAGFAAVAVHGRTREQAYTGTADWEAIGRIKREINIPLWGNGDVFSAEDAIKMVEVSGCDGVMVGRGALGNPWIYKSIEKKMQGESVSLPTFDDKKKAVLRHLELTRETEGEKLGLLKSRRIACWYFKGCREVATLRSHINQAKSLAEVMSLIENFDSEEAVFPTPPNLIYKRQEKKTTVGA